MQAPELAAKELRRCVLECGLAGVQIGSHVNKWTLAERVFDPIWAAGALCAVGRGGSGACVACLLLLCCCLLNRPLSRRARPSRANVLLQRRRWGRASSCTLGT